MNRQCTGITIAPNAFLTAAHCLYNKDGEPIPRYIMPRFDPSAGSAVEQKAPWGLYQSTQMFTPGAYEQNNCHIGNYQHDCLDKPTIGLSEAEQAAAALLAGRTPPSTRQRGQRPRASTGALQTRLEPGRALFVQVASGICLSSSCDRHATSSCSVEQSERGLRVSSVLRRERSSGADVPCTEDCRRLSAICETPKLAAGKYTLRFAGRELTIEVPGKLDQTILESAGAR